MYILVPVWLQVLQALCLLPFAISLVLLVRHYNVRQEFLCAWLMHEIFRLQGYMSSLKSQLADYHLEQTTRDRIATLPYTQPIDLIPEQLAPAPESTQAPAEFVGQLSPIQLSILLRSLGMRAGVDLPTFLQPAPQGQLGSLPESLVKDSAQEPEISNGGE